MGQGYILAITYVRGGVIGLVRAARGAHAFTPQLGPSQLRQHAIQRHSALAPYTGPSHTEACRLQAQLPRYAWANTRLSPERGGEGVWFGRHP